MQAYTQASSGVFEESKSLEHAHQVSLLYPFQVCGQEGFELFNAIIRCVLLFYHLQECCMRHFSIGLLILATQLQHPFS